MIYLAEIIITDFMCFRGQYHIKFKPNEVISIMGEYDGNPERSNRAGKSAFIDAMVWNKYGKSRAKRAVELIHEGAEQASVTQVFKGGPQDTFRITRRIHKKDGGYLEIENAEGTKKKASQEMINRYLGMDWGECEATAFFKQNDIDQFMEADPPKKKTILMRWLSQTNWPKYEQDAITVRQRMQERRVEAQSRLEALPPADFDPDKLRGQLKQIGQTREKYENDLKKMVDLKIGIEVKIKELRSVNKRQEELVTIDRQIFGLERKRPDGPEHEAKVKKVKALLKKYPVVSRETLEKAQASLEKCVSKLTEISLKENDVQRLIRTMKTQMTGLCPVLEEACERIEHDPSQIEGYEKRLMRYEEARVKIEKTRDKCNRLLKLHTKRNDWSRQLATLEEISKRSAHIEEQIADLQTKKREIYDSIPDNVDENLNRLLAERDQIPEAEHKLRGNIESLMQTQAQIKTNLAGYVESKERREGLEAAVKEADQDLADAMYCAFMFGKNGIPSIELENSFQEVEDDANFILKQLAQPFRFEFQATRELKDWESACLACGTFFERHERSHICPNCSTPRQKKRRDELQLKIFEGDNERYFYLDSGGGRLLLSVAIRLALAQLARRRSGSSWGVIYMDEVFGPLDKHNTRKMAELVVTTINKHLGFEQIFLISHDPGIQSATAKRLRVCRHADEGWSELKYG